MELVEHRNVPEKTAQMTEQKEQSIAKTIVQSMNRKPSESTGIPEAHINALEIIFSSNIDKITKENIQWLKDNGYLYEPKR